MSACVVRHLKSARHVTGPVAQMPVRGLSEGNLIVSGHGNPLKVGPHPLFLMPQHYDEASNARIHTGEDRSLAQRKPQQGDARLALLFAVSGKTAAFARGENDLSLPKIPSARDNRKFRLPRFVSPTHLELEP